MTFISCDRKNRMRSLFVVSMLFVQFLPVADAFQIGGREVNFEQVAVLVYGNTPEAKKMKRAAQSRLENILLDNGITVLDQRKADELKNVWKRLEDPGYFVTAEDFVANAGGYEIDGIIRLYLNADATTTLANYHSATAQADIRFVDQQANVESHTTVPMGVPGKPPSDGLTRNAALVNAVQRAVDEAAEKTGLEIIDYARPRTLNFALTGPVEMPLKPIAPQKTLDKSFDAYASLVNKTWTREEVSTRCKAPSGELAAVGGYIRETSGGMRRSYSSVIHLVDLDDKKETGRFDSTTKKKKGIRGKVKLLDCLFIKNWRYLTAVTGLELFLWDTERGTQMSSIRLDKGLSDAVLAYTEYNGKGFVSVVSDDVAVHYQVDRQKGGSNKAY